LGETVILALTSAITTAVSAFVYPISRRVSLSLAIAATAIAIAGCAIRGCMEACIALCLAATSFSMLSSLVTLRRMVFLAAATPHTSVFSVALATALLGLSPPSLAMMFLTSLALALLALALARRIGMDVSTGMVVSLSAVGTVLALYYLSRIGISISSLVVGEAPAKLCLSPLILAAFALTVVYVPLSLPKHMLISIDEDLAKLSGTRVLLHDLALASLLALVGVATVTSVGFVAQHVLILVPPAIANALCGSCREGVLTSSIAAIASAASGTLLSTLVGVSPAGGAGTMLLIHYVLSELSSRVRRRG